MALLPARNILDGTALPVTSQMKTALGSLRDFCSDLLGTDSSNKAAARTALGAAASGANTDITSLGNIVSINGGQLAGMRNLLINGNLAINQRVYVSGTATSGANQYTIDRWRVVTSGQALTFTASGNGNSITAPAGGVEQVIEGANIGGGTYVLGWTGTATATVNGTARAKGESFTLPANTNATVRLIGGAASLVQLEPGGTVTPFEHRPIGMELALCQRYYQDWSSIFSLVPSSSAANVNNKMLPVRLRTSPTIVQNTPAGTGASWIAGANFLAQTGIHSVYAGTGTLTLSAEL